MAKPTKPNVIVPAQFAIDGQKTDFSAEKIQDGFDEIAPDILAGDNLNKFIDDTYKSITYSNAGVEDLYKSAVVYDNAETYNINSLVFNVSNGVTTFYRSVVANNVGNPLNDTNYWSQIQLGSDIIDIVMPIGHPRLSLDNILPINCVWLEGSVVSRTTYVNLYNKWGTTYGAGDGSTTFSLPDTRKRAFYGDTTFGYISAGLPNITGKSIIYLGDGNIQPPSGALYQDNVTNFYLAGNGFIRGAAVVLDASRANPIYGASNTVLTNGLKARVYCRYQ